jgi:hypothetical protein
MIIQGFSAAVSKPTQFNQRWYENIGLYKFWANCLYDSYGQDMIYHPRADFDDNQNDLLSSVFLSKLLTKVERQTIAGRPLEDTAPKQKYERIVATFDNALMLTYDSSSPFFQIDNFSYDLNTITDAKIAQHAILELVQAAYILVKTSEANGLSSIDIEGSAVENFAVQKVCEYLGFDYTSEPVDISDLPELAMYKKDEETDARVVLSQMFYGAIKQYGSDIFTGIVRPSTSKPEDKKEPSATQPEQFDANELANLFSTPTP